MNSFQAQICRASLLSLLLVAFFFISRPINAATPSEKKAASVDWQNDRNNIVERLRTKHGITAPRVLAALRAVPRHLFVQPGHEKLAYDFGNLPIGAGQVIGDIYVVAFMTQALQTKPGDKVLEVGTGSGYQAAVLSKLVKQIYSIEIVPDLHRSGTARLAKLGYHNVETKLGDGYRGWPQHAPFDAIIVTSHPDQVPPELVSQLKVGGRMVLPVGGKTQRMQLVTKTRDGAVTENLDMPGLVITTREPPPLPSKSSNPKK